VYHYGREKRKLFGGKVLENIVQALARIIVLDAAVRLRRILRVYGVQLVHCVHDELVYIVPDELVNVVKKFVHDEMVRPPTWMPDLPLAAEVGVGDNYGDAK
jgi:DNA polymerase